MFREHWPTSAARWLRTALPQPWELVTNPEHADTLERLVAEGEAAGAGPRSAVRRRAAGLARGVRGRGRRRVPAGCRSATPAARDHAGRADRRPTWPAGRASYEPARGAAGSATSRSPRPDRGARVRCCCRRSPCSTACPTRPLDPVDRRRRAHGHRGAQARLRRPRGVVRRRRRRVRRRRCSTRRTSPRGAPWSATGAPASCARARPAAAGRGCPRTC